MTLWVLHSVHVSSPTHQLHAQAAQMLSRSGSTYLCEQLFFLIKITLLNPHFPKTHHICHLTEDWSESQQDMVLFHGFSTIDTINE